MIGISFITRDASITRTEFINTYKNDASVLTVLFAFVHKQFFKVYSTFEGGQRATKLFGFWYIRADPGKSTTYDQTRFHHICITLKSLRKEILHDLSHLFETNTFKYSNGGGILLSLKRFFCIFVLTLNNYHWSIQPQTFR